MKILTAFWCFLLVAAVASGDQADYTSSISDRLHLSGEGGVAYFDTESEGEYPEGAFRVDEAKLFVEAVVFEDIYIFAEINLLQREEDDEPLELGELYIEFEDIGNTGGLFNARVGRFDIPFGEEYLTRDAIDNPLISHSLSDIWGVDEGVEIYGNFKNVEYVFAVQNGGDPLFNDFNSDKALVGRVIARPLKNVHFSLSAMRTGDLDVQEDQYSEVWFGNGFIVPIGSPATTTTTAGEFFQFDGHFAWNTGNVHAALGRVHYDDNDSVADNSRDVDHFYIQVVQNLGRTNDNPWYAATRFSKITADEGYTLVGFGAYNYYLFNYYNLATELWRLSMGIGYRIRKNVLLKAEYSFENGEQLDGFDRDQENFFGFEAAVRF